MERSIDVIMYGHNFAHSVNVVPYDIWKKCKHSIHENIFDIVSQNISIMLFFDYADRDRDDVRAIML